MAAAKKYRCKKCAFKARGPTKLGAHYRRYPSHSPRSGVKVKARIKRRRKIVRGLPTEETQIRKRVKKVKINFCPCCGTDLEALQ